MFLASYKLTLAVRFAVLLNLEPCWIIIQKNYLAVPIVFFIYKMDRSLGCRNRETFNILDIGNSKKIITKKCN